MQNLVAANQQNRKVGRSITFLEKLDPPTNRNPRINKHMQDRLHQSADPTEDQPEEHAMYGSVNPGGRMIPADFVDGHPLVLEQPVANQVNHESLLENGQVHAGFWVAMMGLERDSTIRWNGNRYAILPALMNIPKRKVGSIGF